MAGERSNARPAYTAITCEVPAMPHQLTKDERTRKAAYYAANREKIKAKVAAYRAANREKTRERVRKSRAKNGKAYWQNRKRRLLANPELYARVAAKQKEWAQANRERVRARQKKLAPRYAEKTRARGIAWRKSNPDRYRTTKRLQKHRRRSRLIGCEGGHTEEQWKVVLKLHGNRCAWCGVKGTKKNPLQRDHYISLTRGGSNYVRNLVPACVDCNRRKKNRDPIAFAQSRGLLL